MDKFWDRVIVKSDNECWEWQGPTAGKGYGFFCSNGKSEYAHRYSYSLRNGPIPSNIGYHGNCVCHTCDNPICVNPNHLFLGSNLDNVKDRDSKGKNPAGERNGQAKLKEKEVLEIRKLSEQGKTQQYIADIFGVTQSNVECIVNRKSWKNI